MNKHKNRGKHSTDSKITLEHKNLALEEINPQTQFFNCCFAAIVPNNQLFKRVSN